MDLPWILAYMFLATEQIIYIRPATLSETAGTVTVPVAGTNFPLIVNHYFLVTRNYECEWHKKQVSVRALSL